MFKELLLSAVGGVMSTELRGLILKFRELNGKDKADQLEAAIKNAFLLLKTVTDQTKTKLDDAAVNIVLNSVD